MDVERIREFHRLAQTLSFSETARELNMSVSALSKHIQQLERELGATLIRREFESGGNSLTAVGKRLYDLTVPWVAEFDEIIEECRGMSEPAEPARVCGTSSRITSVASQIRHAMGDKAARGSGVNIAFVETNLSSREALDRGIADFACLYEADPQVGWIADDKRASQEYGWIALRPVRICWIVSASSPLARLGKLSPAEAGRHRLIDMDDSVSNHWLAAINTALGRAGCTSGVHVVSSLPIKGGAFSLGSDDIVVSLERFARYYLDLDVEDIAILNVEGPDVLIYPFLVYRQDNRGKSARNIIDALGGKRL
jgi:DNA-binding transcriptional LysR family regulator